MTYMETFPLFTFHWRGKRTDFFKNTTHKITEHFFSVIIIFLFYISLLTALLQGCSLHLPFLVAIILARPANTNVHQKEKKTLLPLYYL